MSKPVYTRTQIIEQLERTNKMWAHTSGSPTVINYTFYEAEPLSAQADSNANYAQFSACSAAERAAVAASQAEFSDATMVSFNLVADDGTNTNKITYADSTTMPDYTWGWASGNAGVAESIWMNDPPSTSAPDYSSGTYNLMAMTHETAHALGIPHPGDYNAGDGSTYTSSAVYAQDSRQYTIMSYWSESETGANFHGYSAQTLMRDDIAVLQDVYGANTTSRTGDTIYGFHANAGGVYDFSSNAHPVLCIWDAGGNDTIDFSGYTSATTIDLNQGCFSSTAGMTFNVSIAWGADIENAIGGSGNDTIYGNTLANNLAGGAGNDTFIFESVHSHDAASDADMLTAADTIDGGVGNDTVELSGDYSAGLTLGSATLTSIETLKLDAGHSYNLTTDDANIAAGQSLAIDGSALGAGDVLTFNGAAETDGALQVFGGAGNDSITGGAGSDTLEGGSGDDILTGGAGIDFASYQHASAGVSIDLSSGGTQTVAGLGTDTLTSIEGLIGSAFDDSLAGDAGDNILEGGEGNDTLVGNGGSDTVSYAHATGGVTVDLSLATGQAVGGGMGTDTLTDISNILGSAYNDVFIGSSGDNVFNGDSGSDTVSYAGATSGVTVDLSLTTAQAVGAGLGNDTFAGIENIIGSAYDDTLGGNSSDNTFTAGAGNDTVTGGSGSDTVDYSAATSGITVNLSTLTGQAIGGGMGTDTLSGIENVIGSAYADTLTGDAGNNVFTPGAGDDIITGGTGSDTVDYSAATAAVRVDLGSSSVQAIGGGMGSDKLSSIENVIGSAYNDTLYAATSTVGISSGVGDDKIYAWGYLTGASRIDGGAGSDTVYINGNAYAGGLTLQANTIQNVESIYFYSGASYNLTENDGNVAAAATLTVAGYGASAGQSVRFDGTAETDGRFSFWAGASTDTFLGGAGDDSFTVTSAYLTAGDHFDGGAGNDTLWMNGDYVGCTFEATALTNIESLQLSGGSSVVTMNDGNVAADRTMTVWNNNMTAAQTTTFDASAESDGHYDFRIYRGSGSFTGSANNDNFYINSMDGTFTFNGGGGDDLFKLNTTTSTFSALGGAGNDVFDCGANFRAGMCLDGGTGTNSLKLSGDYTGANALVMTGTTLQNIGGIWFGAQQAYSLTMADGNLAMGATLDVFANYATSLIFNGAAETDGNYFVIGDAGNDTITGGGGNDTIDGLKGNDTLIGGAGEDTISYQHASSTWNAISHAWDLGVTVSLAVAGGQAVGGGQGTDTLSGFEDIFGSSYWDTLTGDAGSNVLEGWAGNDTLNGGDGSDTASYEHATGGVTVSLAIATAQAVGGSMGTDTLLNIENLRGSSYGDMLTGDGNANLLQGDAGNDTLNGDGGDDTAVFSGNRAAYTVANNGYGVYTVTGPDGSDTLTGIEHMKFADETDALDLVAPGLFGNNPADDAADVDPAANIVLTFTENVAAGTGNIVIHKSSDGTAVATIAVSDPQITISGNTVTINPVADLDASTGYYVTVDTGAITDTAGNYFAGISSDSVFNFVTASGLNLVNGDGTDNVLTGTAGNDAINGFAGNDTIRPGTGNDVVHADTGDDTISFTGGRLNAADVIDGGAGTDLLWLNGDYSGPNAVTFTATTVTGFETIAMAAGFNYSLTTADATVAAGQRLMVDGTSLGSSNTLMFDGSAETDGSFVLFSGNGDDTLRGGAGNDTFRSGGGFDTVSGGGGNDTISFTAGHLDASDVIDGGTGSDVVWLNGDHSGANAVVFTATTVTNIETFAMAAGFNYSLTTADATVAAGQSLMVDATSLGSSNTLMFDGSAETDGSFVVFSGNGDDTLHGGAGNDTFRSGGGFDTISGGGGNDTISFTAGHLDAADVIDGGTGSDIVWLSGDYSGPNAVVFNATTVTNVETIAMAAGFNYSLTTADATVAAGQMLMVNGATLGSSNTMMFDGSAETDGGFVVFSGAGNDTLRGGAGDDTFRPGGGFDTISGGGGNDTISFTAGHLDAADVIDGGTGSDTVWLNGDYSGANAVVFNATTLTNVESIAMASGFNYSLTTADATVAAGQSLMVDATSLGSSNTLMFDGSAETDGRFVTIIGGAGADTFYGGAGNDVLSGRAGNDILAGGAGADTLTGGAGTNTFAYTAASQSTGVSYDTINSIDFDNDGFDISGFAGAISGIDTAIAGGALSVASFDTDLATALSDLGANHAILFTPNSGTLSGQAFMVVDCNGTSGYQAGQDLVVRLNGYSGTLAAGAFH